MWYWQYFRSFPQRHLGSLSKIQQYFSYKCFLSKPLYNVISKLDLLWLHSLKFNIFWHSNCNKYPNIVSPLFWKQDEFNKPFDYIMIKYRIESLRGRYARSYINVINKYSCSVPLIVVCIVWIVNKPRELELMWEGDIQLKQSGIFKHCCQHEICFSLYHLQYILIYFVENRILKHNHYKDNLAFKDLWV